MDYLHFFFDGWTGIVRILLIGPLAYAVLIAVLRIMGKRTLSQLNAFDLVVTVAIGSMLASIIMSADIALAEGFAALFLLIGLQYCVAWTSVRSSTVRNFVKSEPTILVWRGEFQERAMHQQRVTHDEVRAAMRKEGMDALSKVASVVLETDGSFSVIAVGNAA